MIIQNQLVKISYQIENENNNKDNLLTNIQFSNSYYEDNNIIAKLLVAKDTLKLMLTPKCRLELKKVEIELPYTFYKEDLIFVNGYQSWTDSREFKITEKLPGLNRLPKMVVQKYKLDGYGDYRFKQYVNKKGCFHGFSYSYVRRNNTIDFIGSLSEKNGYTIINYNADKSKIIIEKECEGFIISSEKAIFDLYLANFDDNTVFDSYFNKMNIAKPKAHCMAGYTSWYNHYQNISEKVILDNLEAVSNCSKKLDVFQIDDGYQTAVGDWLSIDKNKFSNGLRVIVDKIKEKGLIAGLWVSPFICEANSVIYKQKPDWLLKDSKGNNICCGNNWSSFYALNFELDEVKEYIKRVFDTIINEWGFRFIKLDFLYAVCMQPQNGKTRGQLMCEAMEFIRECTKGALLLGCGVPLAPCFGRVDFCRIGCDVGLDFDDKPIMRLIHRERVSTKNCILNTIYRRQLNNRAFLNDPDVFLLRDENIKLKQNQKRSLSVVNALFGSLLFTSDNINDYDAAKKGDFFKALDLLGCNVIEVKQIKAKEFDIVYSDGQEKHNIKISL